MRGKVLQDDSYMSQMYANADDIMMNYAAYTKHVHACTHGHTPTHFQYRVQFLYALPEQAYLTLEQWRWGLLCI